MRHLKSGKKLGRNTNQRKALFKSLLSGLFLHGQIKTTATKAKITKKMADNLVSKAKGGSLSVRRQILAFLPDKRIVNKLIDEIAPKYKAVQGGVTRLVRLGFRRGDNAPMAMVELIKKEPVKKTPPVLEKKSQVLPAPVKKTK
jgi:large subunit ribosomal protein L17